MLKMYRKNVCLLYTMNPWMAHVAKLWKKNKGKKSYKDTLVEAKKTYKGKTKSATKSAK